MLNRVKKISVCLLAILTAFSLTACGENGGNASGGNKKPPSGGTLKPAYSEGLEYTLINYDGEYSVTGVGSSEDSVINIPPAHNGLPVTEIGAEAFKNYDLFTDTTCHITAVNIPNSVKTVSARAFWGIKTLKTVVFGENVETVGEEAFYICNNLTEVILPKKTARIEKNAFCGCNSLTEIVLEGVEYIGEDAFRSAINLTAITFGSALKTIEANAFGTCKNLKKITFKGKKSEWQSVTFKDGNGNLSNAEITFVE